MIALLEQPNESWVYRRELLEIKTGVILEVIKKSGQSESKTNPSKTSNSRCEINFLGDCYE